LNCKECVYYEPDYGTWGVFGWSGDGSKGYCCVEPKRVFVDGNRLKCRYFSVKGMERRMSRETD